MISDEMLKEAAARTCGSYISSLLSDYDPEYRCEFSAGFEKKIHRLKRRADHIVFYQTMRRIALILLTLIVAGSIWIAVDTDARATFFGWVGDFVGRYFVFHHEAEPNGSAESADYRPTWIPEGYSESEVNVFKGKTTILYSNEDGEYLRFSYLNSQGEDNWFINYTDGETYERYVNGSKALMVISEKAGISNSLTWSISDKTGANITGFISESELLRMAESVERKK